MASVLVSPVLILIVLLIILLIAFLVYFNIYTKRINRSLEQNESAAHVSMISTGSVGKVVVIIGAVYFAISTMDQLSTIDSDVQQMKNELNAKISDLYWQISDLQEQLEQQNSILNSIEYSLGEVDSENHTVEVTIKCVPKMVSEDTTVVLVVGNESITLEANAGGIFSATKHLPLFVDMSGEVTVAVTTGGITNTEIVSGLFYHELFKECLPSVASIELSESEYSKGKIIIKGECLNSGKGEGMTEVKLLFMIDGVIVKTMDVAAGTIVNETFEIDSDSLFELVAEGKDAYGYTHRNILWGASVDSEYMYLDGETILDKDGKVLFGQ